MAPPKGSSALRTLKLLKIAEQKKVTSREQLLSDENLEFVIKHDTAFMRLAGTQREVTKEKRNYKALCRSPASIPYRMIFDSKLINVAMKLFSKVKFNSSRIREWQVHPPFVKIQGFG
jgi:hypothetical protein